VLVDGCAGHYFSACWPQPVYSQVHNIKTVVDMKFIHEYFISKTHVNLFFLDTGTNIILFYCTSVNNDKYVFLSICISGL
jgi:hypothetical protein